MYEERKYTFDWKGFILKLLLVILIIFAVYKLFPVKNNTFNDSIYNSNITTMKEAAKSYYTVNRLPKTIGESKTMTLQEMLNQKMLVNLTDKNGNSCDTFDSYIDITRTKDDEYLLKVQLSCDDHIDYIIETIGCYDVCTNNDCKEEEVKKPDKTIEKIKVTQYQFRKKETSTNTTKSCRDGYTLNEDTCYKTINSTPVPAKKVYYDDTVVKTGVVKTTSTIRKDYTNERTTTYETISKQLVCTTEESYTAWKYVGQYNSCSSSTTVKCEYVGMESVKTCGTCGSTLLPVYKKYTRTKEIIEKCPSCDAGWDQVGKTCYKEIPSGQKCPSGYTSEYNSGILACYKSTTVEGASYCEDKDATPKADGFCYKTVKGTFKEYKCTDKTMILDEEKGLCYSKTTETYKAIITAKTTSSYKYMWSTKTKIAGWERTNKTRKTTINKEVITDKNTDNNNSNNNNDNEEDSAKDKIITDSNKEITERINNNSNTNKSNMNISNIILYVFIGIGMLYLFVMFINSRRNYQN